MVAFFLHAVRSLFLIDSLLVESPSTHPSLHPALYPIANCAERKVCFVGMDEKGTHLHYILSDFGDLGEELQGEDQADDAEAAGCYAAVFVFHQRVSFVFLEFFPFSFLLRLALASGEMRTDGLCDASGGVCRRGEVD